MAEMKVENEVAENVDVFYMRQAIFEAELAAEKGEIPVGAVVVRDGVVIGRGRNSRESDRNALAHAEIAAINEACKALGGWRLPGCKLYVTMEPCPMCAGAVVNARIDEVICATKDSKAGAFGSVIDLNSYPFNHKPKVSYGVCEEDASRMVSDFFVNLRRTRR